MNYENSITGNAMGYTQEQQMKASACMEYETRTVESNIDMKIAACKAEIARLERSKIDLAPLLKMRIRDIQQAMQF